MNPRPLIPGVFRMLSVLLVIGLAGAAEPGAENLPPALPARPSRLLRLLPEAPELWEITRSEGKNSYSSWLFAQARRDYTAVPDPVENGEEAESSGDSMPESGSEPAVVTMILKDTCGAPALLHPFVGDLKGTRPLSFRRLHWRSLPALIVAMAGERRSVRVLVEGRYIVEVVSAGLPLSEVQKWLEAVDYEGIGYLPKNPATKLPTSLEMEIIDELNPARSRSYSLGVTTPEAIERILSSGKLK